MGLRVTYLLVALLTVIACSKDEATKDDGTKKNLPFRFAVYGKLSTSGTFSPGLDGEFHPIKLVHPSGSVIRLTCDGANVELVNGDLKDGIIATKEFGELEVFDGPNGLEVHGTDTQRRAIEQYGKKTAPPR